jgi:hypothetical protein
LKDTEAAYLAGFIEGDGSIYIGRDKGIWYRKCISIINTSEKTINYIINILNKDNYKYTYNVSKRSRSSLHKPRHSIEIYNINDLIRLSEIINPYLISKKSRIENLINVCKGIECEKNHQECKKMNGKSINILKNKDNYLDINDIIKIKNLTETQKSFISGIIDSEGSICFGFDRRRNTYTPILSFLVNTNSYLVKSIRELLKPLATLSIVKINKSNNNWNPIYDLKTRKIDNIVTLLPHFIPYLVTKKIQGEMMLQYINKQDNNICTYIKNLNKRGI